MNFLNNELLNNEVENNSPVFAKKFRGKSAKELYRCCKGIIATHSIVKPVGYALAIIPKEMSKGYIYSTVGDVGESVIAYASGLSFIRYAYRVVKPSRFKVFLGVCYNCVGLPMTIYSMGFGKAFDVLQVSKLESLWFGSPVYIFNDNRLFIEGNCTVPALFKAIDMGD